MALIAFLLVITPVVVIHEAGHMWAAKSVGIPVTRFSVGFGKTLFNFTYKGTEYCWKLLPFGGYVQFYTDDVDQTQWYQHSKWARFLTVIAGPLANFVLTYALFYIVALIQGAPFWHAFIAAFHIFGEIMILLLGAVGDLFTGQTPVSDLAGPVGIAEIAGEAVTQGAEPIIMLIALLSINIGLFNLLPIPALDGGQLFILGIETVSGRDLSMQAKGIIQGCGIILLLILTAWVLVGDVLEWLFRGAS